MNLFFRSCLLTPPLFSLKQKYNIFPLGQWVSLESLIFIDLINTMSLIQGNKNKVFHNNQHKRRRPKKQSFRETSASSNLSNQFDEGLKSVKELSETVFNNILFQNNDSTSKNILSNLLNGTSNDSWEDSLTNCSHSDHKSSD